MTRLLLLSCLSVMTLATANDLDKHIESLQSSDLAVRLDARKALISEGAAAVKALHGVYFADIDTLLRGLGDENFRVRKKATARLIQLGERCQARVQSLMESTDDPEVKFRCESILKKIKGKPSDKGLQYAVEVTLGVGLDLPENEDFMEFYFVNFEELPNGLKQSLPKAIALCKTNKFLTDLLPKLKKNIYVQPVLAAIKARMPQGAPKIIEKYEDLQFERSLNITTTVQEMQKWRSYSTDDFEKIARRLEAQPLYEKKRPILIKKFLSAESNKAKALGIRLAKDNIKPFVPLIISQLKGFKSSPHPMFYFWDHIKDLNKHFHPHIDVFLSSKVQDIKLLGMKLCHIDPQMHKATMLELFKKAEDRFIAKEACQFLLNHFPKLRNTLQKQAVQRILKVGAKDSPIIESMTYILRECFKYQGDELGDWWSQWSEIEGVRDWHALDVALRVNAPCHLMIPLVTRTEHLPDNVAKYLLKGAKADRQLILNLFMERAAKEVPHYSTIDKILLKEMPDCYEDIVPKIMALVSKETKYSSSFHNILNRYSIPIQKKPSRAAIIRPYLFHETMFVRYYAAVILLNALPKDKEARAVLDKLAKSGHKDFREDLLKDLYAFGFDFEVIRPMLKDFLIGVKDGYHEVRFVVENMTPELAKHRKFFLVEMELQAQKKHWTNATLFARGLLQMDDLDKVAIEFLTKLVLDSDDMERAAQSLETLGKFDQDPVVPMLRLEEMYTRSKNTYAINQALAASKKNLYRAIPIVTKHLNRNLDCSYSELDDLTWKNEEYQRALTASLVEALAGEDATRSERALSTLTSGSCTLKNHIETLKTVYGKDLEPKVRRSFLWMLANMETDAAPFAAIIPKRYEALIGDDKSHYLFAMSRISPEKKDRKAFTLKFVEHLKGFSENDAPYRMLRLIKEFPSTTFPILRELIEKREGDSRYEAVWGLIREKPFSKETTDSFSLLFKRCQSGGTDYDDVAENLCWALRGRVPDAIQFLPLLKNANPKLKADEGYQLLMHDIRKHQRKK